MDNTTNMETAMKTPEPKYLFIPGIAAALVLTVATPSPQRVKAEISAARLAQYCVPSDDEKSNMSNIYC